MVYVGMISLGEIEKTIPLTARNPFNYMCICPSLRKILLPVMAALAVLLVQPPIGQAQTGLSRPVETALTQFPFTAGGWYLNQICNYLGAEDRREFEWHMALISASLAKAVRSGEFEEAQRLARDAAESEKLASCPDEGARAAREALAMARVSSRELSGKSYVPGVSYKEYSLQRYSFVVMAVSVDTQCHLLTPEQQQEVLQIFDHVTEALARQTTAEELDRSMNEGSEAANARHLRQCGARAQQVILRGVSELRALEAAYVAGL